MWTEKKGEQLETYGKFELKAAARNHIESWNFRKIEMIHIDSHSKKWQYRFENAHINYMPQQWHACDATNFDKKWEYRFISFHWA